MNMVQSKRKSQSKKSSERKLSWKRIDRPKPTQLDKEAVTVDKAGRFVLPSHIRKLLAIQTGDHLTLTVDDHGIRLQTCERAIKRAQALMRKHNPNRTSLVDELIKERRAGAASE